MSFLNQACKPPQAGSKPFSSVQAQQMCQAIPDWALASTTIKRDFQFKDFREAMAFVNQVAELAEAQQHHPDIAISYKTVRLTLTTHKIGGLSQNDFIMAAKIDCLVPDLSHGKGGA